MLLKQIILSNFRNFANEKFVFNPFLTIIIGENARGKTNLLESIYLISHGEGFRESREDELIKFEQSSSEVQAVFASGDENFLFQMMIKRTDVGVNKIFSLNKARKKYFQYQKETAKTVLFSPEQIEIMLGPPEKRRRYFDNLLSSFDIVYKKRLTNYENALRKRNKILGSYHNEKDLYEELTFWNAYLTEQASYLIQKRQQYVDFLNQHKRIDSKEFSIEYRKNEFNQKRLEENFELEKRYRKTVIGPQKDDFQISQKNESLKNLHHYGSRSEQRLAVIWLKFNEIKYFEEMFESKPLLLLDDIFSELDVKNKKLVIDLVKKYQTIITTTEVELLELADVPKSIITL